MTASAKPRFPARTIALVLTVSVGISAWLAWTAEHTASQITKAYDLAIAGEAALGEMGRLDEVLTASARLSAATAAPKWKIRYDENAPLLDAAMAKAGALASPALKTQFKNASGAANDTLLKLEAEAFAAPDPASATAILDGPAYAEAKTTYAAGVKMFSDGLKAETMAAVAQADATRRRALIIAGLGLAVLAAGWFVLIRTLLTWRRDLDRAQSDEAVQREAQREMENRKVQEQLHAAEEEARASEAKRLAEAKAAEDRMVVQALGGGLSDLAAGDLTVRIENRFPNDYEALRGDFNASVAKLLDTMTGIVGASHGMQAGTDEISVASDDLARRTEQQAASLEETAAALDQLTATVSRTAEGAKGASTAATSAKAEAEKSGVVMRNAVTAMSAIEQSSNKITQIIGVIDEIAFQTNLLALNAGVEAARAGDAGRGFAVVAQEVRGLAQRAAEAAKEIKGLIASSSEEVKRGVRLVGDTGQALDSIAAKVAKIDVLIAEIAQSAQEQATGLNQVNIAVNQMDQVTQQNAAMVEEATAAAARLKGEATELAKLVAAFETGDRVRDERKRPALVASGQHSPAANPVRRVQGKLAAAVSGGASGEGWEEF